MSPKTIVPFYRVFLGVAAFLLMLYGISLWELTQSSGSMMNKFSTLAREQYLGFLIQENLWILLAYLLLALAATTLAQPLVDRWTLCSKRQSLWWVAMRGFVIAAAIHGFFKLRLMKTRPYFLDEAEFGHWYYKMLDFPEAVKPVALFILFTLLPLVFLTYVLVWHLRNRGRRAWLLLGAVLLTAGGAFAIQRVSRHSVAQDSSENRPPNILIIGSDSLRGDRLGYAGYRPERTEGLAAAGVSPVIDELASRSFRFQRCYTSVASTMESGLQLMASQYPHSNGIRHMYPDRKTVEAAEAQIQPLAQLLRKRGYDTAAIGDWCAGYYDILPLGFEHVSVSSFDNFKIYMSQAVIMAHFVVPLYFDNSLGRRIFPQLESFAQFVTPEVVTHRVERRLESMARQEKPFFWHVFYSCNHLPYRSNEPYVSMFSDPAYRGANRNGVDFDIDSFIGGTDLESKWKALSSAEVAQIRALYDGCTRQFDDCVGKILNALKRTGLDKNTIVIITADHGDDLYEPGVTLGHGLTFNGGLQANHVPMVVHVPGLPARDISETVRLIDLAPTLADFTGVEKSDSWEGQSFADWIRGTAVPEHRPFYGESGFPFIQFSVPGVERPKLPSMDEMTFIDEDFNYQFVLKPEYSERILAAKQRCLRSRDWKLVCTPTASGGRHFGLFHLASDLHGEVDLAESKPEVLRPMQVALEKWMDERIESPLSVIFPDGEPSHSPLEF